MAPSLTTSQTLLCPDCFEWPNADFLALVPSLRARDGVSEGLRYETPTDQRP